jgi:Tol biopolymer transport system component/DNA-binding winged helix-turn-helix (wHTH) protein
MSLLINQFYRFGEFTLDTDQRVLLRDGKRLPLTTKVFDTLLILVENNGRIVEKEELMNRLWPDTFVEDANLTFNIKQLRKSLGDDARNPVYIETIARRGYRFIANVEEVPSERAAVNDQITRRFETSDAQSPDAEDEFINETQPQRLEFATNLANERYTSLTESKPHPLPPSRASLIGVSKKSTVLLAAVIIILAGVGLVFWGLNNSSDKNSNQSNQIAGKPMPSSGLKLEKLTATGQSRLAAISPDGKYIAYTRYFEKKTSIWLRQVATNTNVEIVPPSVIYGLAFTNSGESLYFARRDPTASLYRVSLLGGLATKIVDNLEGDFAVSSDDRQIVFIRKVIRPDGQREYDLAIVNSDGTGERTLLGLIHPERLGVPVWSPDGQSIICSYGNPEGGGQDVRIVEVKIADGIKKELSSERFFHITRMAWLPHHGGLVLCANRSLGETNQLWRVSYPGMEISQITEGLSSYLDLSIGSNADEAVASEMTRVSDIWVGSSREPRNLKKITQATSSFCWTPTGRLVYFSSASGIGELWIMNADGTEQKQLTNGPAVSGTPAATSDNRYIVFMSNRSGALQVWRMNIDGSDQIQLTEGEGKNFPAISPDGKWVVYTTTSDLNLWKISIDGGEPIRLTEYIASRPCVSPDGKMIACVGGNASKRELLILPFEGGQPLKKFDFGGWDSRLQWTADGKALVYAAERNGATVILKQRLEGGLPKEIRNVGEDELFDFGYSFDGRSLAVTRGEFKHDIVLIKHLL